MAYGVSALPCRFSVSLLELAAMTKRSRRVAAGLDLTRNSTSLWGVRPKSSTLSTGARLTNGRCLQNQLLFLLVSALPFREEFLFLLAHVMKHSSNGSQSPQLGNGRALGRLKEVRSTQDKPGARDPQVPGTTERYSKTQSDILKRLRTLPASPPGGDAWGKRLAWPEALASGSYCSDLWPAHYTQRTAGERPRGCCDCCDADRRARLLACRAATR